MLAVSAVPAELAELLSELAELLGVLEQAGRAASVAELVIVQIVLIRRSRTRRAPNGAIELVVVDIRFTLRVRSPEGKRQQLEWRVPKLAVRSAPFGWICQ